MDWRERWVNQPRFKLYTDAGISQASNSLTDAAYFNPSQATAAEVNVIAEWLQSRRFERSLWHRVIFGAGSYAQKGWQVEAGSLVEKNYGSLSTTSLKYEQDWKFDRATALTWGVGIKRHPYDGRQETARYLDMRLNWRL